MSRQMVFLYWCDNKAAKHPPLSVEAETVLVYSPKKDAVVDLDLCESCLKKVTLLDSQELADLFGRESVPEQEVGDDLVCPLGCNEGRPYKTPAGRNTHIAKKHPDLRAKMLEEQD